MSATTLISAEAIKAYHEKHYDDREIMEDGSVGGRKNDWTIACLIDGRFQGLTMPLLTEGVHDVSVFPLEAGKERAAEIARVFNDVQMRLAAAKKDPSRTLTVDEVMRAYEDMYFMLTPMTDANRYLRELIDVGMAALGLPMPILPRQAFDGEALSEENLAAYRAMEFTNYTMMETGLELSAYPLQPILNLIHGKCSSRALFFSFGDDFESSAQTNPVKEGVTAEQAQRISLRFIKTQLIIESTTKKRSNPPSKAWVEEAFTDYHNMLQPTTVENRYQRTLIEKALDAMKLDDSLLDARSAAQFAEDERRIAAQTSENQGRAV